MAKILPRPTALSQPYWDGAVEGALMLQQCADCSSWQFYPRIICTTCGGDKLEWKAASGGGCIASFTVVRRGISADYPAPYIVALVDLDEGPRMMTGLIEVAPEDVQVGKRVEVTFGDWSEDIRMPLFRLVGAGEGG